MKNILTKSKREKRKIKLTRDNKLVTILNVDEWKLKIKFQMFLAIHNNKKKSTTTTAEIKTSERNDRKTTSEYNM